MRRTNLAAGAALAVALLGGLAACGQHNDTVGVQTTTGSGGSGFGFGGGVSCSGGPDYTGCPCTAGETRACYTGPADTRGVAPCADGVQTCMEPKELTYVFGPCTGETVPVTLVPSDIVYALAVDATTAYFIDSQGLESMPSSGGTVTKLSTGDPAGGLVMDATTLYWMQSGAGPAGPYTIVSMPKAGGTPKVLYGPFGDGDNCTTGDCLVDTLSIDATSLYWSTVAAPLAADAQAETKSRILKLPKAGGTPVTLRTGEPAHLLLDGTSMYVDAMTASTSGPYHYTLPNRLLRMSVNGGATTSILDPFSELESPSPFIAVDAANLYYVGSPSNAIVSLPKSGAPAVTLATTPTVPFAFAADDACIYWLDFGSSSSLSVVAK